MIANRTLVEYNFGNYNGFGFVVGVATTYDPAIGYVYIVEDTDDNFPNKDYPYDCFACPESLLSTLK